MRKHRKAGIFNTLILLAAAAVILFPVVWALCAAFKQPWELVRRPGRLVAEDPFYLGNFGLVLGRMSFIRYFFNSLLTSLLVSAVRLLAAALAAYAFVFFRFPLRRVSFMLVLGTMMIPPDILVIANYRTVASLGWTNTYLGVCVVAFIGASQMFMLRQAFTQAPSSLSDAARMDGCGDMMFLFRILLPQCRGVVYTLLLQVFVNQWNAYLWPLLVTDRDEMRTLQVGITMLRNLESTNYEEILAGVILALAAPLLLLFISRRLTKNIQNEGALAG